MAKRILKKSKWLRQLFACLLILAMVPAPMSAYAAQNDPIAGSGITSPVEVPADSDQSAGVQADSGQDVDIPADPGQPNAAQDVGMFAGSGDPFPGSGTEDSPYEISTPGQLLTLAQLVNTSEVPYAGSDVHYLLTADIDISAYGRGYNGDKGWVPIGNAPAHPFYGHFDGGGHQISGLYINDMTTGIGIGLFGFVTNGATVEKVLLPGARVIGVRNVGAVAGYVSGTIRECAYLAVPNAVDLVYCRDNNAGGIAGYVKAADIDNPGGLVESCYSTGHVSGGTVGGVAGVVDGKVQDCYATGPIGSSGYGTYVGGVAGIVGYLPSGGTVQNCYSTGLVMGGSCIGGVVGGVYNHGRVQYCMALNPGVTASNSLGGRVVGMISAPENTSSILAFNGMTIAVGGAIKNPLDPNLDGLAFTVGTGFPSGYFDAGPWVSAADKLPGLGAAVELPAHLVPLAITTASLPGGSVGTTYCVKLAATGGTGNYTWSATGLPVGMRVTPDGYLRGVPAAAGTHQVSITLTDDNHETATRTIALTIAPWQDSPLSHWTERSKPDSMAYVSIYDIAYYEGVFVGVGAGMMTSADGVHWTEAMAKPDSDSPWGYEGVAYGEGTLVAVGWKPDSGMISTKTGNGAWEEKTPSGCRELRSVAYAGDGTFIAVGYDTIMVSTDLGITWNAAALPAMPNGTNLRLDGVASDRSGHAVASGYASTGESILWHSADWGTSWSKTAFPIQGTGLNSVAYGNGVFIAVGSDGTAYRSADSGSTWEESEIPGGTDHQPPDMTKIAFGSNTFVAVGQCGDGQYNVISSSDNGVTWTGRYSKPNFNFETIAYGNNSFVKAGWGSVGGSIVRKLYQSDPLTSDNHNPPTVTTGTVTDVTASGATLNGNVTAGGSAAVTARGFVYGLSANPENDGAGVTQIAAGSGTGGFNAVLTGLAANTTYHVRAYASNSEGTSYGTDVTFTTLVAQDNSGSDGNSHSGSGGGGTVQPENPTVRVMDSGGNLIQSITAMLDSSKGTASVEVSSALLNDAFDKSKTNEKGMKTVEIDIPKIDGVKAYESTLPASFLTSGDPSRTIEIKTDIASVTMPGNMVSAVNAAGAQKISLAIATGDKSKLEAAVQSQIGDRPVIELALKVDGKQTSWSNEMAPVTVSIPYTPTAAELKDQEHIVIWYINGSGNVISVPNGHYDPSTGTVTFTTTHFSRYAVAYVHQTFGDLGSVEWARKSIEVMASKGIIKGTGENIFSPSANITRADYLVLLVKTLGLTANLDGNFDDVQPGAYYYEAVGIAKKLGIATGSGNNHFNPKENITRQDMMTLTAHALEEFKEMRTASDTTVLDQFSDKDDIAGYAKGSLEMFVKNGLISGSGDKLNPLAYTTRAEAAVFLYRINNMH